MEGLERGRKSWLRGFLDSRFSTFFAPLRPLVAKLILACYVVVV